MHPAPSIYLRSAGGSCARILAQAEATDANAIYRIIGMPKAGSFDDRWRDDIVIDDMFADELRHRIVCTRAKLMLVAHAQLN